MNDDKLGDNSATTNWSIYQNFSTELGVDYRARVNFTRDTSSVSESSNAKIGIYVSLPGQPKLSQPNPDNNSSGFNHINYMVQNFPDQILTLFNSLPTLEGDEFPEDLDQAIAKVPEETLAQIGGGDPKKGALMLRFAALHPDANVPANLATLATTVRDQASTKAGHGPSPMLIAIEDKATNGLAQVNFQMAVLSMNLSEADQKALYFANNVPSAAALLSPALQAALKNAQGQAATKTENATGCPPGWLSPPDAKAYEAEVGKQYATNVTNLLSQQLLDGTISKAQYNEMRTLFFSPDADTPNRDTLLPLLNTVTGQATQGLQKQFGVPNGYSPQVDAAGYNGILNCTFSANFSALLAKQSPALTPDQQTLLKGALLSSAAEEALPPDLKAIFESVKDAAIAKLSSSYGVPLTWTPNAEVLSLAATKSQDPGIVQAQIMLDQGKEWLSHAKQALTAMNLSTGGGGGGGGPLEVLIKNYMKTVALALSGMQEMLYELSTTSADMASMMNKVQNDAKIGQLKKQKAELDKMIAEQKKMDSLGPLKVIFQWIIILILVMFLGPVGLAIAALLTTTMVVQSAQQLSQGKSIMDVLKNMDFIDDLAKTFAQMGNAIGGPFGQFLSHLMTILTLVSMAVLAPELVTCDLMIGSGSLVKNGLEALGVPPQTAQTAAMAIQMIAQVTIGILLAAITGGASIASAVVGFAKTCATAAESIVEWVQIVWEFAIKPMALSLGLVAEDSGNEAAAMALSKLGDFKEACNTTIAGLEKIDVLAKDVETAGKTLEDTRNDLARATQAAKDAGKDEAQIAEAVGDFQGTFDSAEEAYNFAKNAFDTAFDETQQMQTKLASYIERANDLTGAIQQVSQAIPTIENKIIQAQITRIKANMDAEMITVEQFCKMLIALVQKLMDTVTAAGNEIKDIGSALQNLFSSTESTLSNLARSSRG